MSGVDVRQGRKAQNLTQDDLAQKLGVSQGYVSLLERGRRSVPQRLATKLVSVLRLPPTALPVSPKTDPLSPDRVAGALSSLGYPGFAYLRDYRKLNPAELVVRSLLSKNLEARVVEALPWVLVKHHQLDWNWLLSQAKLNDLQNRLGFVVTVAKELAERQANTAAATTLATVEPLLEHSRLQREDTFSGETLTQAERRWLQNNRSGEAARWNLLTNVSADVLASAYSDRT